MAFMGFGGVDMPGGPAGFPGFPRGMFSFKERYRCFSMAFSSKTSDEIIHGGKIIMPPSALEKLARLNISYPMLFKLSNPNLSSSTHCGVLEFVADEGKIYVSHWMMNQLCIQEGEIIEVQNVSLKLATFSKFQPQSVDFLDITNPKAVLESKLRSFACLTKDDTIGVEYNGKIYELLVMDTKPDNAVSIIECDMKVDFAAPVGYVQPEPERMLTDTADGQHGNDDIERDSLIKDAINKQNKFQAFSGEGQRLSGKVKNNGGTSSQSGEEKLTVAEKPNRGIPNYNYRKGKITFVRAKNIKSVSDEPTPFINPHNFQQDESERTDFIAFAGEGKHLRIKKKKFNK